MSELRSFTIAGSDISSSIAIDSSTRNNTTVTVAVELADRFEELRLIEEMSEVARRENVTDFKLFSHKASDIDIDNDSFFEQIIDKRRESLVGFHHVQRGNETQHEVEAVHTALLIDSLLDPLEDRVIIIDGGRQKANPAVHALFGLREAIPSITHCIRSELYYPQNLLADLTASYLSHAIETATYDYADPLLRTPYAERTEQRWGAAFSALKRRTGTYRSVDLTQLRGNSPRERAQCWFQGGMAHSGARQPTTNSITPIIRVADKHGFSNAKAELKRLA